jgi:hypothetical protein
MNNKLIQLLTVSIVTAVLASGCIVVDLTGCSKETVKGSGKVISEQRQVPEFKTVKLKGFGKVVLTKGEQHTVEIRTDDNIMPLIETEVANGNLVISQGNYNLKPTTLDFEITVKELKGISISGSGDVTGKSRFVTDDFFAKISGSGDMALELDVVNLETGISGSGSMNLAGKTDRHDASISGSGKINAFDMDAKKVSLKVSGSGDCKVVATETLNTKISGSGDVFYKGHPQVNSKISGSGSLESRNE